MYRSFKVKNFRGLRNLEIDSLERVNLIAGKNNAGKTALLEALFIHSGPNRPTLGLVVNQFRGAVEENLGDTFDDLFWKFDAKSEITLCADGTWGSGSNGRQLLMKFSDVEISKFVLGEGDTFDSQVLENNSVDFISNRKIVLEYTDENDTRYVSQGIIIGHKISANTERLELQTSQVPIQNLGNSTFIASGYKDPQGDAAMFSKLRLNRKHHKIESMMRRVEPSLQSLSVIAGPSLPTLHAELSGHDRLVPMRLLGEGVARLLSVSLAIATIGSGIVLIDEIENGLHHSVLKSVWSGIAQFAREFNVQIFATTHSGECIRAAHQAFSEDELYDFKLHRLERIKDSDDTRAVTYSKETLEIALNRDLEVR